MIERKIERVDQINWTPLSGTENPPPKITPSNQPKGENFSPKRIAARGEKQNTILSSLLGLVKKKK